MIIRLVQFVSFSFVAIVGFVIWLVLSTPSAAKIKECLITKQYKVRLCPGDPNYIPLSRISSYLKNMIIIAEDSSFYSHQGFDWDELQNSVTANLSQQRLARGGSTITQQLAKNVFLNFDKSISRKIREALLAQELEQILSKGEILERYLNVIEFGPGVMGVGAAAKHYFGKTPAELNLLESAFLTYLVPNPKVYSRVFKNSNLTPFAKYRIMDLSYRMFRFHKITQEQYVTAKELATAFPWTSLSSFDLNRLNGMSVAQSPTSTAGDPVARLPEVDQSLVPVEPSPEEQEVPAETPATTSGDDSPFER